MGAPTAIFLPVLLLWMLTERNCTAQDGFVINEIAPESRGTLISRQPFLHGFHRRRFPRREQHLFEHLR